MYETLPTELIQEINSFLSLKSKLCLTTCKKKIEDHLRKHTIRVCGMNLLIPYLDVRHKNPLFYHEYDVIENKHLAGVHFTGSTELTAAPVLSVAALTDKLPASLAAPDRAETPNPFNMVSV